MYLSGLRSVLQRMIAPDPKQRFSFYDDLLTELDAARRALEIADARRHSSALVFLWTFPAELKALNKRHARGSDSRPSVATKRL